MLEGWRVPIGVFRAVVLFCVAYSLGVVDDGPNADGWRVGRSDSGMPRFEIFSTVPHGWSTTSPTRQLIVVVVSGLDS